MEQSLLIDEVCCAWKIKSVKRDIDVSAPRGALGRRRTKSRPNSQSSARLLRLQAMKITQLSRIFTTQKFLYITVTELVFIGEKCLGCARYNGFHLVLYFVFKY